MILFYDRHAGLTLVWIEFCRSSHKTMVQLQYQSVPAQWLRSLQQWFKWKVCASKVSLPLSWCFDWNTDTWKKHKIVHDREEKLKTRDLYFPTDFCFRTNAGEAVYVAMATISLHDRAVHVISLLRQKYTKEVVLLLRLGEVRPSVYDKRPAAVCWQSGLRLQEKSWNWEQTSMEQRIVTNLSLTKSWLIKSPSWL